MMRKLKLLFSVIIIIKSIQIILYIKVSSLTIKLVYDGVLKIIQNCF